MTASIQPVLDTLKELDEMIITELKETDQIDTPLNRHALLTEIIDELKEEMPDSLAKRSMLVMFDWYLENLLREARFEDPIPAE